METKDDGMVILAKGKATDKHMDGSDRYIRIVPCVMYKRGTLGVGLYIPAIEQYYFFGWSMPLWLIHSWRAMKLIEELPSINTEHLRYYFTLTCPWLYDPIDKLTEVVAAAYGSFDDFRALRAAVLSSFPIDEELEAMLAVARAHDIEVLESEILDGQRDTRSYEAIYAQLTTNDASCITEQRRRQALLANPKGSPPSMGHASWVDVLRLLASPWLWPSALWPRR